MLKKISRLMLTSVLACGLLVGCSKATAENYAKVDVGMTQEQVHALLGKPGTVNGGSIGPFSMSTETWQAGKQVITITFTGNKVGLKSIQDSEPAP